MSNILVQMILPKWYYRYAKISIITIGYGSYTLYMYQEGWEAYTKSLLACVPVSQLRYCRLVCKIILYQVCDCVLEFIILV